jgi:hypothetical protein
VNKTKKIPKLGSNKKLKKKELTKEWCDFLWSLLVKALAGFKSEISESTETLNSHHLAGKPNYWLRYIELDNGICITQGEHKWGYHHTGRAESYREHTKKLRGVDIYERLEWLKNKKEVIGLAAVERFLLEKLAGFNKEIIDYYQSKDYKSKKVIGMYEKLFKSISESATYPHSDSCWRKMKV